MAQELKRSAKHHCYTEGKTIQRADIVDAVIGLVWVCGHCGRVVEPVTDEHLKDLKETK